VRFGSTPSKTRHSMQDGSQIRTPVGLHPPPSPVKNCGSHSTGGEEGTITGLVGFREEIKKFLSPAEVQTLDHTASRQLLDRRHTNIRRLCKKFSGHGDAGVCDLCSADIL